MEGGIVLARVALHLQDTAFLGHRCCSTPGGKYPRLCRRHLPRCTPRPQSYRPIQPGACACSSGVGWAVKYRYSTTVLKVNINSIERKEGRVEFKSPKLPDPASVWAGCHKLLLVLGWWCLLLELRGCRVHRLLLYRRRRAWVALGRRAAVLREALLWGLLVGLLVVLVVLRRTWRHHRLTLHRDLVVRRGKVPLWPTLVGDRRGRPRPWLHGHVFGRALRRSTLVVTPHSRGWPLRHPGRHRGVVCHRGRRCGGCELLLLLHVGRGVLACGSEVGQRKGGGWCGDGSRYEAGVAGRDCWNTRAPVTKHGDAYGREPGENLTKEFSGLRWPGIRHVSCRDCCRWHRPTHFHLLKLAHG